MKKTFCITASHYYPHPGGLEMFVQRLAKELSSRNYRVIVLTHDLKTGHNTIEKRTDNLTIVRLDAWLPLKGRLPICKNNSKNKEIFQWLKKQNITCFVINTRFYKLSKITAKLANSLNITPILIDHGSAHLTIGNKLLDPFVEFAEHYLTNRLSKYRISYYGISNKSVEWLTHFNINAKGVLPNAIDVDEFSNNASKRNIRNELNIPKDDFVVYFVGRYTAEKGLPQLLSVIKNMQNNKNIHFIFSGKGPYDKNINKASKFSNTYNIKVTSSEDVAAIMKSSNVLCLPTRSEGFCTTLLEASACKLPTVITNVGGVEEVIKNNNYGYILNDPIPEQIEKAIIYMKNNKKIAKEMGVNSYKQVAKHYNWSSTTNLLLKATNTEPI